MRIVRDFANAAGFPASVPLRPSGTAARPASDISEPRVALPTSSAPPTPWNKAITQHRRFAIRTSSLSNIKRIKEAADGTVNDVVMAICAGGLRTYLMRHDALPDRPLRAMVPVSIRTGDETDPWTNRVPALVAELPTDEPDPLRARRPLPCGDAGREAAVRAGAGRGARRHHPVLLARPGDGSHAADSRLGVTSGSRRRST